MNSRQLSIQRGEDPMLWRRARVDQHWLAELTEAMARIGAQMDQIGQTARQLLWPDHHR